MWRCAALVIGISVGCLDKPRFPSGGDAPTTDALTSDALTCGSGCTACYTDDFGSDADNQPPMGWTQSQGSFIVETYQGRRAMHTAGSAFYSWSIGSSWQDYTATADVYAVGSGSVGDHVALRFRFTPTPISYDSVQMFVGQQLCQFAAQQSGSAIAPFGSCTWTMIANAWHTLSITAKGSVVSASVDGSGIGSSATAPVLAGGTIGFYSVAEAGFANVRVCVQ